MRATGKRSRFTKMIDSTRPSVEHHAPITRRAVVLFLALVALSFPAAGCRSVPGPEQHSREAYIYYLDGSGGAGLVQNWSRDVRAGFLKSGYAGSGKLFRWQTGLGMTADHTTSVGYKRKKAQQLAADIEAYREQNPRAQINLIGFSAGTAVLVYALEALPDSCNVDNVILLSSSLGCDYNLTQALERVRNRFFVFASQHDEVLRFLVPFVGTADREKGTTPSAGIRGFNPPLDPSPQTVNAYGKLVEIHWEPEFRYGGHKGRHADAVKPRFIGEFVVPLISRRFSAQDSPRAKRRKGHVDNPSFQAWDDFAAGSWSKYQTHHETAQSQRAVEITERIMFRSKTRIFLERAFVPDASDEDRCPVVRGFFVTPTIRAANHPLTHPQARTQEIASIEITIKGRAVTAQGRKLESQKTFTEWGNKPRATYYWNKSIPGKFVSLTLDTIDDGVPTRVTGHIKDFQAQPFDPDGE
jgi:pimeloyl-ACP methyl ester carboxylesterase